MTLNQTSRRGVSKMSAARAPAPRLVVVRDGTQAPPSLPRTLPSATKATKSIEVSKLYKDPRMASEDNFTCNRYISPDRAASIWAQRQLRKPSLSASPRMAAASSTASSSPKVSSPRAPLLTPPPTPAGQHSSTPSTPPLPTNLEEYPSDDETSPLWDRLPGWKYPTQTRPALRASKGVSRGITKSSARASPAARGGNLAAAAAALGKAASGSRGIVVGTRKGVFRF